MRFFRLTEQSPSGEAEVVCGWYTKEIDAYEEARSLRLKHFEVVPFSSAEVALMLTRLKIYD